MTAAKRKKSKNPVVQIEGEMTIYRAEELKQALITPMEQPGKIEVNLSGVTELDTVGVQLLMLAKRTAQAKQCELCLVDHSPAVIDVFELLNLVSYFGDQVVITPRSASRN